MSNTLKAKLTELETQATAIERTVLKLLTLLEKPKRIDAYVVDEAEISEKLLKLDELQDEIDSTLAELKTAGLWEPVSYAGNVYQYNPPKIQRPAPVKVERKPIRVYPVDSPRRAKVTKHVPDRDREAAKQAREAAREAKAAAAEAAKAERARVREEARLARAADTAAEVAAAAEARIRERLAAMEARQAKRKAVRVPRAPKPRPEPKPKSVRPPKAKPAPKPRKPAASRELRLARKLMYDAEYKIERLDDTLAAVRTKLEADIAYQEAKLEAASSVHWLDGGPQQRANARLSISNCQRKMAGLPERKVKTLKMLTERKAFYEAEVARLTTIEFPTDNHSQLV
jgi:hypothetical protein